MNSWSIEGARTGNHRDKLARPSLWPGEATGAKASFAPLTLNPFLFCLALRFA
jgi:hypothetical protein